MSYVLLYKFSGPVLTTFPAFLTSGKYYQPLYNCVQSICHCLLEIAMNNVTVSMNNIADDCMRSSEHQILQSVKILSEPQNTELVMAPAITTLNSSP